MNTQPAQTRKINSNRRLDSETVRRLYEEECLTLRQVAERLSVSRQAVHDRLIRDGVKTRSTAATRRHGPREAYNYGIDAGKLRELYLEKGLGCSAIGRRIGVERGRVWRALIRENIPRRAFAAPRSKKYAAVYDLKPGESALVSRPNHAAVYQLAKRLKIRLSVRSADETRSRITRIA